jgi:hypothetical protein
MACLIAPGAFCVIHRAVGRFDQIVKDLARQIQSVSKPNTGHSDARGDPAQQTKQPFRVGHRHAQNTASVMHTATAASAVTSPKCL